MAFSSGWWDLIVSAAPISQGQWKSLGQQSRLQEGDGARFCQTEHVCADVCVCVARTEFYDADSKQEGERDIMLPTPVVNWGQSSSCRECLQTCLCYEGLQSSRRFSLKAKSWRIVTLDPFILYSVIPPVSLTRLKLVLDFVQLLLSLQKAYCYIKFHIRLFIWTFY